MKRYSNALPGRRAIGRAGSQTGDGATGNNGGSAHGAGRHVDRKPTVLAAGTRF